MPNDQISTREFDSIIRKLEILDAKIDKRFDELRGEIAKRFDEVNKRIDDETMKHRLLEMRLLELETQFKPMKAVYYLISTLTVTGIVSAVYALVLKKPGGFP